MVLWLADFSSEVLPGMLGMAFDNKVVELTTSSISFTITVPVAFVVINSHCLSNSSV